MRSELSISQAVSGIAATFQASYCGLTMRAMTKRGESTTAWWTRSLRSSPDAVELPMSSMRFKIALDLGLEVAVRGGRHHVAGRATVEGGLMIDLSLMKGIHVDPTRRMVRAQSGASKGAIWVDPASSILRTQMAAFGACRA